MSINLDAKVTEIMASPVKCIEVESTIAEAAKFLIFNKITGAPVIDKNKKAIGVLTMKDITRYSMLYLRLEQLSHKVNVTRDQKTGKLVPIEGVILEHLDSIEGVPVKDIITPHIKTCPDTTSLKDALGILVKNHIHRIFITNSKGAISGVITTFDIISWLSKSQSS